MITGMHIFFVKATFSFEGRNNRDIKIGLLQIKTMLHLLSACQMSNIVWINNAKLRYCNAYVQVDWIQ